MIRNFNHTHSYKQSNKLFRLLEESKWKHIGCPEMVVNLTNFQFSTTKMEAISLGLKFATGIYKNITTNIILDNYWNCDTNFSKGFIQGIILTTLSQPNESSLPKRYTQALPNLTQTWSSLLPTKVMVL